MQVSSSEEPGPQPFLLTLFLRSTPSWLQRLLPRGACVRIAALGMSPIRLLAALASALLAMVRADVATGDVATRELGVALNEATQAEAIGESGVEDPQAEAIGGSAPERRLGCKGVGGICWINANCCTGRCIATHTCGPRVRLAAWRPGGHTQGSRAPAHTGRSWPWRASEHLGHLGSSQSETLVTLPLPSRRDARAALAAPRTSSRDSNLVLIAAWRHHTRDQRPPL